eukprot:m.244936 g.244936  ORF g.244936 m.244936 type:complete len:330 (-) comp19044_c0_seq5:16-1005(-)
MRHMDGELSVMYDRWRQVLLRAIASVEAYIDFGEDEGIENDAVTDAINQVKDLRERMARHISDDRCGERLRAGVNVAIVGRPDVGKSSLLNLICRRDAAIVSAGPGTTRDVIEVAADIGGFPAVFRDTAGLRYGGDVGDVESEGVRRAEFVLKTADLVLCVQDTSRKPEELCCRAVGDGVAPCVCDATASPGARRLVALNKTDLDRGSKSPVTRTRATSGDGALPLHTCALSCKTQQGYVEFLNHLQHHVEHLCTTESPEGPAIAHLRHRAHLQDCLTSLDRVLNDPMVDIATLAQELRDAAEQFGYIDGRIGVEEMLGVLFREFCIGK